MSKREPASTRRRLVGDTNRTTVNSITRAEISRREMQGADRWHEYHLGDQGLEYRFQANRGNVRSPQARTHTGVKWLCSQFVSSLRGHVRTGSPSRLIRSYSQLH